MSDLSDPSTWEPTKLEPKKPSAYEQGQDAHLGGYPITENPYEFETVHNLWSEWRAGWMKADDLKRPSIKNKFWCEGWDARKRGASRLEYPYDGGTGAADDWIAGWDANRDFEPNESANPLKRQEGGDHYKTMPIQPFEYIHANGLGFAEGAVVKYVSRWKAKGGIADLRKARHFLDLLIEAEVKKEKQ